MRIEPFEDAMADQEREHRDEHGDPDAHRIDVAVMQQRDAERVGVEREGIQVEPVLVAFGDERAIVEDRRSSPNATSTGST